jgi:pimeloyl-ACP methyl ester carboxylesterase
LCAAPRAAPSRLEAELAAGFLWYRYRITADGRPLAARRFGPPGPPSGAAILFIHGAGSDQSGYQPRAEAASKRLGATCLTFDLGGDGNSGGDGQALSPQDHLQDCVAAFDALLSSDEIDADRVGVCGASYGGFLASMLTASRRVRSLLLRAPGLYEFAANGVPAPEYVLASGNLPPGVVLATNGKLEGKPTTAGEYKFSLRATNAAGSYTTPELTITIA